ncbi:MAG: glycosyltransferase family 2 protein [Rhodobacteraceae bacterium]|nr:glycosyltransferase family 2 protein [Paracoccaceae bacterium]
MQEPPQLVVAFVAHYLQMGASHVQIYLDGPNQEAQRLLSDHPRVTVTLADAAHYRSQCKEPMPSHMHRKLRLNANLAYVAAQADWLLHVDADEYVQCADFGQYLATVPQDVDTVRIPNGERVFFKGEPLNTIFDGGMAKPVVNRPRRIKLLRGEASLIYTDRGFFGHTAGKSITRTGRSMRLGIHAPMRRSGARKMWAEEALLCHFDGLTRFHWVMKLLRYADASMYDERQSRGSGRPRYEQLKYITQDDAHLERAIALHDEIRVIDAERAEKMRLRNVLVPMEINPAEAVWSTFGRDIVDLSPEAFDDHLRQSWTQAKPYQEEERLRA